MDGALIIDKPAGWTSHDVVARVRKLTAQRRVGHTGTLDPFATGVLVILLGRATRLAQFLSGAEKEYEALIRLGYGTDTGDVTGTAVEVDCATIERIAEVGDDEIQAALATLRGEIEQIPPMYSAKKIAGQKLYDLARRGETVDRQAVQINIKQFLRLSDLSYNEDGTADLRTRVVCSAGTYIRVLAGDLGKRLGVGAHLVELRRTRAGQFTIDDAFTLDRLREIASGQATEQFLVSPDTALSHLPAIDLPASEIARVMHGVDIPAPDEMELNGWVRLREANGSLLAVGIYDTTQHVIHPKVVIGSP